MRPGLFSKLSDQSSNVLSQLEESSRRVNLLLGADNQQNLMRAIASLGQAAASIGQLSANSNKVLPQLVQDANATLKIIQDTSIRVGASADEARASARAFKTVTERMNAKDGTLDQLTTGAITLSHTGQTVNAATLPRVNRAVDDAARTARQLSRAAGALNDNPQSLLFGNVPIPPGPGEPGFDASLGKP
jgi:phospholipid/cholesterol/gamma-HCH transport system substrate-binding protein